MKSPLAWHLTARTLPGTRPFASTVRNQQLWRALRATFPKVYAAVIMPNHFHLVIPGSEKQKHLKWRIGVAMRAVSQAAGPGRVRWSPAPDPQPLVDAIKVQTVIRYVHLNPVRAGITRDPLAWCWSTLLELTVPTLASDGWVDIEAVAQLHRRTLTAMPAEIARFTLSDPFCSPESRAALKPWEPDLRPTSRAILRALEILNENRTPYQVQAHLELAQLSIKQIAHAISMSERGARKALARLNSAEWSKCRKRLQFLLANPRLASYSPPKSSELEEL